MAAHPRKTRLIQAVLGRKHLKAYIEADNRRSDGLNRLFALEQQIYSSQGDLIASLSKWADVTEKRNEVEAVEKQYLALMEEEARKMVARGFALIRSDYRIPAAKFLLDQGYEIKFAPKSKKEKNAMEKAGIPVNVLTSDDEKMAAGHGFSLLIGFDEVYQLFLSERKKRQKLDELISALEYEMEFMNEEAAYHVPERDLLLAALIQEEARMKAEVEEMIKLGYVYITDAYHLRAVKSILEKGYEIRFIPECRNEIVRRAMFVRGIPITELPPL